MSTDTAANLIDASPWMAEPDPIKLAILGKLGEELNELGSAVSRCIIQGMDGVHPVTGKPNLTWLWEEIADVRNMIDFVFRLTPHMANATFEARLRNKRAHIDDWLKQIQASP